MTEAERQLIREATRANTVLMDEINFFKIQEEKETNKKPEIPEEEDPRVKLFTVTSPVKVGN